MAFLVTQRCEVGTNFRLSLKSGTDFGWQHDALRRRQFVQSGAHCARQRRLPHSDSRMSSRRQRTYGSEFCPLGHLRYHRGSRFAGGQRFEERQAVASRVTGAVASTEASCAELKRAELYR